MVAHLIIVPVVMIIIPILSYLFHCRCPSYPALPYYCFLSTIPGRCCPSLTCDVPSVGTYNPIPQLEPSAKPTAGPDGVYPTPEPTVDPQLILGVGVGFTGTGLPGGGAVVPTGYINNLGGITGMITQTIVTVHWSYVQMYITVFKMYITVFKIQILVVVWFLILLVIRRFLTVITVIIIIIITWQLLMAECVVGFQTSVFTKWRCTIRERPGNWAVTTPAAVLTPLLVSTDVKKGTAFWIDFLPPSVALNCMQQAGQFLDSCISLSLLLSLLFWCCVKSLDRWLF